jgi:hypothetical protein
LIIHGNIIRSVRPANTGRYSQAAPDPETYHGRAVDQRCNVPRPAEHIFTMRGSLGGFMTAASGPYMARPARYPLNGRWAGAWDRTAAGAIMGAIRLLAAPLRRLANSRLVQFAAVVAITLLLDHYAYDYAVLHAVIDGLKSLVTTTVQLCSKIFRVGILTDPMLQAALTIAYVYVACLLIFFLLRHATRKTIDAVGRNNFLWLRNSIARERGIAAYRAWLPLETIRPGDTPQDKWEQEFAWPADNKPPYPPLRQRILREGISTLAILAVAAVLLQLFTPFPVLSWLGHLI